MNNSLLGFVGRTPVVEIKRLNSNRNVKIFAKLESANPGGSVKDRIAKYILEQVRPIDMFIAGIGTGGTLMGVGRRFREESPNTRIIGVEPHPNSKIQDLRNLGEGYIPPIFDFDMIDDKVNVSDDDAYDTAKDLARYEGLFCGISSGAAMAEALNRAERMNEGNIVVYAA